MNCPKCGENNPDGGSFCKACGAALPNSPSQPQSNGFHPQMTNNIQ